MYKNRVKLRLIDEFFSRPGYLRDGAWASYALNFTLHPTSLTQQEIVDTKSIDMSCLPDEITTNLRAVELVRKNVPIKMRADLEYLPLFTTRVIHLEKDGATNRAKDWPDELLASEKWFKGIRDYYYSTIYHTFDIEVQDDTNFVFMFCTSVVLGPVPYLRKLDEYIYDEAKWTDKMV